MTPANLTRVAPVSIFLRQDLAWLTPSTLPDQHAPLSPQAESVRALLAQRGALFGADLRSQIGCGPAELDEVLGELICRGLLTADGFAGLRQFLASRNGVTRPTPARLGWTRQRMATTGTGRWSLWRDLPSTSSSNEVPRALDAVRQPDGPASSPAIDPLEQWAWQLLRRWGVVFRDVLEREDGSPPWWQLLQVFRRWEARGEIRGGRFVTGVAGEQYALPDTIQRLRQLRNHDSGNTKPHRTLGLRQSFLSPGNPAETSENPDNPVDDELVVISAVDPLNLVGIITSDERVPRLAANRVVLWNGAPVAAVVSRRFVRLRRISAAVWDTVAARLGKSRTEIDVSDEVVEATV